MMTGNISPSGKQRKLFSTFALIIAFLRVVMSLIDSTKQHQEIKKGKVSVEAIDEKRNGEQIRVGRSNKRRESYFANIIESNQQ